MICHNLAPAWKARPRKFQRGAASYSVGGKAAARGRQGDNLAVPPLFLRTIEESGFSAWLRESESPFAFYFVLLFHTFGLALLVGANAVIDLRLLGIEREIPLMPLKRLFGIMWAGFAINAASGVVLLIAYPTKALTNPVFYLKLVLIAIAVWVMTKLNSQVFGVVSSSEARMMARARTLVDWLVDLVMGVIREGG